MMNHHLDHYFDACAIKVLAAVDVDKLRSNQHEFNGAKAFREILGEPAGKVPFSVHLLYLGDHAFGRVPKPVETVFTWYDARQNNPGRRPEYRLYYRQDADDVLGRSGSGDSLFLFKHPPQGALPPRLTVAIVQQNSTILRMLHWLLSIPEESTATVSLTRVAGLPARETVAMEPLLTVLGMTPDFGDDQLLDSAIKWFGSRRWPSPGDLSSLARALTPDQDVHRDPDTTILRWLATEHALVRSFERYFTAERLRELGWSANEKSLTAPMMAELYAGSCRQRTWASESLREHMSVLLQVRGVSFSSNGWADGGRLPELIFEKVCLQADMSSRTQVPSLSCRALIQDGLDLRGTIAASTSPAKVLTVQPALAFDVTNALDSMNVRLVVPRELQAGYTINQQASLITVSDFIETERQRQGV